MKSAVQFYNEAYIHDDWFYREQRFADTDMTAARATLKPTSEIRDGLRQYKVMQQGRLICVWWSRRPKADLDADLAKLNQRLKDG